jgi:hypothetical protein
VSPGARRQRAGDVVRLYEATAGRWRGLGPVTRDDVLTAQTRLGMADEPWTQDQTRRLAQELERIARERLPIYRVGVVKAGKFVEIGAADPWPDEAPILAIEGRYALVADPAGRCDNGDEALTLLRRHVAAARDSWQINEQALARRDGAPMDVAAARVGVSETTLHNRRRALRKVGIDPDTLDTGERK